MAPPSKAPYKLNQKDLELEKQVNNLLNQRYIRQNKLPHGALVLFMDKKDDKLRMHIDYHALNKITIKNYYYMSRINDLLDQLNKAEYFS